MASQSDQIMAPALVAGLYVGLPGGHSQRWHTAARPIAKRTDCGIWLPGQAASYEVQASSVPLAAVCRRCATMYLPLVQALGMFTP